MTQYIPKDAVVAEIEKCYNECLKKAKIIDSDYWNAKADAYRNVLVILDDTIGTKEVDVSDISENLTEAYEYLDFTSTGNLAHNKPMMSARLKKAIRSLFDSGLFELTHDKKYRMENLGLKEQKRV